jgi:Pyridoxamine 5'-phosphate oxidase
MRSPVADERRRLEELSSRESMRLLGSVSLGRIVFTARALPAIRPVNHLVDGDYIIIRTDSGAPITSELRSEPGSVVAYEADMIDPAEHLGWSVIVVGVARQVIDPAEAAPYRRALRPWVVGTKDQVIAIHADMVTGFRLVAGDAAGDGAAAGGDLA